MLNAKSDQFNVKIGPPRSKLPGMVDANGSGNNSSCIKLREIEPAVIENDHGNMCQRDKIRCRQNAWQIGEVAARYGARCNLRSAFVGLRPDSRRTGGESIDIDSG